MSGDGGFLVPAELSVPLHIAYLVGTLVWATKEAMRPGDHRVIQFPVYVGDGNGPRTGTITDLRYPEKSSQVEA